MAIKTVRGLEAMTRQEQRELHLLSLKNKRLRDLIAVCKYPVGDTEEMESDASQRCSDWMRATGKLTQEILV